MTLRNLSFHIGDVSAPPGDPSRLIDRFPTVQRAAFSVANHYMANLHNVTLDGEAKLILQVNPQMGELDGDRIEWMDNIRLIPVPFPLEDAAQLTGTPLKATILECIQNSLLWYAALKGESSTPFESAYRTVVDASLVYTHYYKRGKSWKAPSGKRKFKLFVVFEWDRIDVYAEVMCGRTTEGHLLLHSTVPVEYPYPSLIQDAKWSGHQNIRLSTVDFATASKKAVKQSINNLTPGPVSR